MRRSLAGGEPRHLRTVATRAENKFVNVSLAAGPQQTLLYERTIDRVDPHPGWPTSSPPPDVLAVSNAGAVETLVEGCVSCSSDLDFSGSVGLYPVEGGQVFRDFASPPAFERMTVPQATYDRVAGDYVVETIRTGARVLDWRSGEEIYRLEGITPTPTSFSSVDVQADGKIAFAYVAFEGGRSVARVGWASPAEPFEHRLPVDGTGNELRLDGDQVVFSRTRVTASGTAVRELVAVGLSGPERVLVRGVQAGYLEASFDYDGSRVAWLERGCDGPLVASAPLADLSASPRLLDRGDCRLKLPNRPRFSRNRRLVFALNCAGFTYDCSHQDRVVRTARAYRLAGRLFPRGTRINLGNQGVRSQRRVRLRLTKTGRLLLARRSRTRLRLSITLGDGDKANTTAHLNQRRTTPIIVP